MAYLHCRIRVPIPIQTANQMATLYHEALYPARSQIQIPIPTVQYMKELESDRNLEPRNVNKPLPGQFASIPPRLG